MKGSEYYDLGFAVHLYSIDNNHHPYRFRNEEYEFYGDDPIGFKGPDGFRIAKIEDLRAYEPKSRLRR